MVVTQCVGNDAQVISQSAAVRASVTGGQSADSHLPARSDIGKARACICFHSG